MSWSIKKLGEVSGIYQPQTITSNEILKEGAYKVFGANGVIGYYSKYNHEDAEVLVTCRGATCGTVNMSEPKSWITGNAMVVHPKDKKILSKAFLFYVLKRSNLSKTITGTGQPQITRNSLAPFQIPLPPPKIQKQIVERLDKIAEAQKLNDDLIQKTDEFFQSLLHKELNPTGKNWEVKKLGDLITDTTNGFASRPVTDGVGQLRPNNVDSDGSLNLSSIKFVPKNYRNIKKYFLMGGDILFNNTNSVELVGKTAFIDTDYDYVFSNHMTRIRANEEMIVPKLLAIFLQHFYSLGKFRFLCTPWVNQAAVNSTALKRIKISLPPLKIQKQIVAKLSAVQEYKTQLLEQKSKLKELFDSALAKSFSGQ